MKIKKYWFLAPILVLSLFLGGLAHIIIHPEYSAHDDIVPSNEIIMAYRTPSNRPVELVLDRLSERVSLRIPSCLEKGMTKEDISFLQEEAERLSSGYYEILGDSGVVFQMRNGKPTREQYLLIESEGVFGHLSFAKEWVLLDSQIHVEGEQDLFAVEE